VIKRIVDAMPLPNDFQAASGVDGLNTARYRSIRRRSGSDTLSGGSQGDNANRNQYNVRLDHNFNSSNKLTWSATWEHGFSDLNLSEWPGGFNGLIDQRPRFHNVTLRRYRRRSLTRSASESAIEFLSL